ncbi:hypothetical protein Tco_0710550 [Tanacetum coccineum]
MKFLQEAKVEHKGVEEEAGHELLSAFKGDYHDLQPSKNSQAEVVVAVEMDGDGYQLGGWLPPSNHEATTNNLKIRPAVTAATTQNINNTTIRSILLAEKLTGLIFTNWYRNLRIVLRMMNLGFPMMRFNNATRLIKIGFKLDEFGVDRGGDGGDVVWWQRGGVGWGRVAMMVTRWRQRGEGRDGNGGCEGSGGKERWR